VVVVHRAATGNIAIFVGGERKAFEKILPALTSMGRKNSPHGGAWNCIGFKGYH
jgi:NAD binding domain of 6-phosphogluconate dehydrogenase.